MLLADTGFAEYGPLGLIVLLLAGWLTFLGKWVIGKFTAMIADSNGVIQRNTDVVDSWKRNSTDLAEALNGFKESSAACRRDVKEIVQERGE
jgi:hypothetical protein